jgi:hypothetical protein
MGGTDGHEDLPVGIDSEGPDSHRAETVAGWRRVGWTIAFGLLVLFWSACALVTDAPVYEHVAAGIVAVGFAVSLWYVAVRGVLVDIDDDDG